MNWATDVYAFIPQVLIDLKKGVKVDGATVVKADIEASNGVVHVIDKVILPSFMKKTVVDVAVGNPDFSILVEALKKVSTSLRDLHTLAAAVCAC